ncbi:MAG TPA: ABC-2 family transporter protein, partial [Anaerolineales bacterium]|nr:ABC-2 family transporter protein [Anaerolineales bacterium]
FHGNAIYRFEFWMRLFWVYLLMYSIYWVWETLYTQSPGAFGVSLEQMVTYGILGMTLEIFLDVGPEWYMATQVRTGAIDTDLMKPLDFHLHMLARSAGEMLFGLGILALPAFVIGYYLFDLRLPGDTITTLLFAVSLLFSFFVFFHISFLLGILTVITLDIRSISWAYYSIVSFFSGQIVPLWLFPDFLRRISEALPFQAIYYIPMSIYIKTLSGSDALQALGLQVFWTIVLVLFSRWAWSRVHARLTVQGG